MTPSIVHVAVAAIVNNSNQVLIAKRPDDVHQGGLWEFPGGKVEAQETVEQALSREIKEELNIQINHPEPLIRIEHHYSDKSVLLDVWIIKEYTGEPIGFEGQSVKWEDIASLNTGDFPVANQSIIRALQLPELYMITGKFDSIHDFILKLKKAISISPRIVQLRCKHIDDAKQHLQLADLAQSVCDEYGSKLLLNTTVDIFNQSGADGLHLNSRSLFSYASRPIPNNRLLSVSCHNEDEINQAELLEADIVLLSPVKETSSHPGVKGMGWGKFNVYAQAISSPVYALGGMNLSDLKNAKSAGAQGIAAISSLWINE